MRTWQVALLFSCLSLLLLLALGIDQAQASPNLQSTGTPTPTFQPLYGTSTPIEEYDLTCPTALPIGWGTSTPGLLWNSSCGQCLATLQAPTATTDPLITPTAVPTATPTPFPAAPIVFDPVDQYIEWTTKIWWNYWDTDVVTQIEGKVIGIAFTGSNYGNFYTVDQNGDILYNSSELWNAKALVVPNIYSTRWQSYGGINPFEYFTEQEYLDFWATNFPDYQLYDSNGQQFNFPESVGGSSFHVGMRTGPDDGSANLNIDYLIGWGTLAGPTPTPAPTGVPSTYCSTVNGVGFGGEEFNLGIELPQFGYGVATCAGVDEIVLPLSALNLLTGLEFDDIVIPGLQICFREISFGTLSLFGVDVDLDSIATLMAAALIIRWMLRS